MWLTRQWRAPPAHLFIPLISPRSPPFLRLSRFLPVEVTQLRAPSAEELDEGMCVGRAWRPASWLSPRLLGRARPAWQLLCVARLAGQVASGRKRIVDHRAMALARADSQTRFSIPVSCMQGSRQSRSLPVNSWASLLASSDTLLASTLYHPLHCSLPWSKGKSAHNFL